ncbi:tol-pal system protein YbgF [Shewanella intestini]|uniref:Cell division coordinator CpoB n=1 Tax=Shewanella intestini TaxID=2017544 RepID=A0ABS5I6N4_9GAMM|nr:MULTISPECIES: tol-pal system protein YbgF [Shewanella]MBR9729483.1 tol-pal system protein YbgF [Shewanella intestini]MRG37587.1 tol-pal system protein YbgF [Shewanella sp. XMDDZSB0408]
MKRTVLMTAMIFTMGNAMAAAPVVDIAAGSSQDRIAKLERILKAKQQSEFDMQRRLDTLQSEVLELRGLSEQQQYQMDQMLQRQRQLYEDIANLNTKSAEPVTTNTHGQEANSVPSSLGETASYEAAVNLVLKERKYDEAIPAFGDFIKQYPQSTYAPNANYWLGQLLYNKGTLDAAKNAFNIVVNKYPKSSKRGDSLVKLGMIAEKQNDKTTATSLYNSVLKEYPNSASARLAKQQLTSL